jgi:hypothetical protein
LPKFKFRKHHRPNFLFFLGSQTSLAALIQVSKPLTYDKRTYRGVAHWYFLLNELRPQQCQSFVFHSQTPSGKAATNLIVHECSAQAQAFERPNDPHTLLLFSLVKSFKAKGISLKAVRAGFEPELPVHFRT